MLRLHGSDTIFYDRVLDTSWLKIQAHSQQESLHRSNTISLIESSVVQPLSVFLLSDLEKRFQSVWVYYFYSYMIVILLDNTSYSQGSKGLSSSY